MKGGVWCGSISSNHFKAMELQRLVTTNASSGEKWSWENNIIGPQIGRGAQRSIKVEKKKIGLKLIGLEWIQSYIYNKFNPFTKIGPFNLYFIFNR